jgi:hypothetical protein
MRPWRSNGPGGRSIWRAISGAMSARCSAPVSTHFIWCVRIRVGGEVGQELLEEAILGGRHLHHDRQRAVGAVLHSAGRKRSRANRSGRSTYDVQRHVATTLYGSDHGETAHALSLTKWVLGAEQEAIALQSGVDHASLSPPTAWQICVSLLSILSAVIRSASRRMGTALRISGEHGLTLMDGFARCTLAVAGDQSAEHRSRRRRLKPWMACMIAPNALRLPYKRRRACP